MSITGDKDNGVGWQEYVRTRSIELRDRIFLEHLHLIKQEAGRMLLHVPASVERVDLESAGAAGLLSAVERFDPGMGVPFNAYALRRIRGAIVDELRRMDLLGRDTRRRLTRIREAEKELLDRGVEPTGEELARMVGISTDEYYNVERAYHASRLGRILPEGSDEKNTQPAVAHDGRDPAQQAERHDLVSKIMEELSEREQLLVTLHYYEDMTLREISRVIGVSEGRVSQIHAEMVARLRRRMQ